MRKGFSPPCRVRDPLSCSADFHNPSAPREHQSAYGNVPTSPTLLPSPTYVLNPPPPFLFPTSPGAMYHIGGPGEEDLVVLV